MEKKKQKRSWKVSCMMCETSVHLELETIVSTDQGAEFLLRPDVLCAKCKSVCVLEMTEEDAS